MEKKASIEFIISSPKVLSNTRVCDQNACERGKLIVNSGGIVPIINSLPSRAEHSLLIYSSLNKE